MAGADPYLQHYHPAVAKVDLANVAIRSNGPEADPYMQHYEDSVARRNALPDLATIIVHPVGPEADPYLEHTAIRKSVKHA